MKTNAVYEQTILSVSGNSPTQAKLNAPFFLQENEQLILDLHSRTLLLMMGNQVTKLARLSPLDTQLLLPLIYFHPHHVSDRTFSLGYTVDLPTYYQYLMGKVDRKGPEVSYPIADGIERLKKKIIVVGITVVRVRNVGYMLDRSPEIRSI